MKIVFWQVDADDEGESRKYFNSGVSFLTGGQDVEKMKKFVRQR